VQAIEQMERRLASLRDDLTAAAPLRHRLGSSANAHDDELSEAERRLTAIRAKLLEPA
jgi:predicted  nucleic acid-binding Zn-ribbon protein